MKAALTSTLALQYLAELDPAIVAVAVVGAGGATFAGDPSLAARLGAGSQAGSEAEGRLLSARSSTHVVIAQVRPEALAALVSHDLEMVARDLG